MKILKTSGRLSQTGPILAGLLPGKPAGFSPGRVPGVLPGLLSGLLLFSLMIFTHPSPVMAATDKSGSIGLQGVIPSPPPQRAATITVPSNGASFTTTPITVSGLCTTGLLVKIFANNIFVGSTTCVNGSYSLQINLYSGQNDLVARVYDALDQPGPDSNVVRVTFNDAQFLQFGTHVSLNSAFAERGALPGTELDWPVVLSGGTGPYAMSVDWGDGTPSDLFTVTDAGSVTLKHTYKIAGVYKVVVKATDKNGGEAFLQLVGQATGAIQNNDKGNGSGGNAILEKEVLWWPAVAMLPLIIASFWIGRRYELYILHKKLEQVEK